MLDDYEKIDDFVEEEKHEIIIEKSEIS